MSKTPEKKAMPKLYIRFAEHKDLQNILDFYETNQHSNVRKREEKILEDLAGKGSIVLIEDEKGVIVASSISYPHSIEKNGAPSCQWVEVGSTRIVANGYPGLFDVMTTAQILRAYLVEPPEQCFVGHMEHKAVQGIAKRFGWKEFKTKAWVIIWCVSVHRNYGNTSKIIEKLNCYSPISGST